MCRLWENGRKPQYNLYTKYDCLLQHKLNLRNVNSSVLPHYSRFNFYIHMCDPIGREDSEQKITVSWFFPECFLISRSKYTGRAWDQFTPWQAKTKFLLGRSCSCPSCSWSTGLNIWVWPHQASLKGKSEVKFASPVEKKLDSMTEAQPK